MIVLSCVASATWLLSIFAKIDKSNVAAAWFLLNLQWIHWLEITPLLYLYLVVWGVTDWAFFVSGSNCTHSVNLYHFSCNFSPITTYCEMINRTINNAAPPSPSQSHSFIISSKKCKVLGMLVSVCHSLLLGYCDCNELRFIIVQHVKSLQIVSILIYGIPCVKDSNM